MWHDTVRKADAATGRLLLGFLNTCSDHPVITIGFLAVLMALVIMMWIEMFKAEHRSGAHASRQISRHR